jgi:hypothetical protein
MLNLRREEEENEKYDSEAYNFCSFMVFSGSLNKTVLNALIKDLFLINCVLK